MSEIDLALKKARDALTAHVERRLMIQWDDEPIKVQALMKENDELRKQVASLKGWLELLHDLLWKIRVKQ